MCEDRATYSNTEYERLALSGLLNLSDGHARHLLSAQQRAIIGRASELLDCALTREAGQIELEFLAAFFACARQPLATPQLPAFLTYSASCAIKLLAQCCRLRGLKVHLIEPCFDNIRHLLEREGVPVMSIREEALRDCESVAARLDSQSVLWIVQPNNPTGFCLSEASFRDLIQLVAQRRAMIVIDFCFRFFADDLSAWDQYQVLTESTASFACIEDTGKTWALGGVKVGVTLCSPDLAPTIHRLHDELLLNVSLFELVLLTQFVRNTLGVGVDADIRAAVEANRVAVHSLVERSVVTHATNWCRNVPMELFRLPSRLAATEVWHELRRAGVEVLPAHNYFWSTPGEGATLFRIPLSRPRAQVLAAIPIIERVIRQLGAR
jgi:aspartate/methionine/tyrosine aminotransferase